MKRRGRHPSGSLIAWLGLLAILEPSAAAGFERTETREDCAHHQRLRQPFFGDTHVHTALSFDAWGQGTRNRPRDAYRFARGESVGIQPFDAAGLPVRRVKLRRPLHFAVVTDHAELLGETNICSTPGLKGHNSLICIAARRWPMLAYAIVNSQMLDIRDPERYGFCGALGENCAAAAIGPWEETQAAAEEAYDRTSACRFTSFVGYEWSGNPDSSMIHRNVVFRNEVVPPVPANYVDDATPERLWERLRDDCLDRDDRCDVLAIPHNSNLSNGLLFRPENEAGGPLTREQAEDRASLEVLAEVTQHKGDSECAAGGSDELCGFETLRFARMFESATPWNETPPPPSSYLRNALAEGLVQHARIGANPFRLGLIGSTDTHLGTPGLTDEQDFPGHAAGRTTSRLGVRPLPDDVRMNPGGLAVLWAEENSRDSLFEAMRRRETYGTSGPRMWVRFFGGWDYPEDLCSSGDFVAQGYRDGVPMGGELPHRPGVSSAPSFAYWALRDPGSEDRTGIPLQRVQIVKAWERDGKAHHRVIEVAGDPNNGADVDLTRCAPRGTGFDELCGVWRDPDFEPTQHALYYARVVENPTCRWSSHACLAHGVDCAEPNEVPAALAPCCDPAVPRTVQERAWTSPIWYTPSAAPAETRE